jgi:GNAT superfamily N-acetyltransferase
MLDVMEIRVFPSSADLPDHLRWQIISIIRMEWYGIAGDYTGPQALPDPWHPSHVVGTQGDAIISYAGVVWRDIEHAGQVFRTYGLSSVFTFPALRRRGFGGRVVRCATSRIRQAGDCDIAVLFTADGMEPFYERSGWQAMPSTEFLIGDRASPARHDAVAMMLFMSAKGKSHRPAFQDARVYFGEDPW